MDVAGAQALRERLDQLQQLHWHQAPAVREGRQEAVDPDAEHLVARRDGVREYEPRPEQRFRKELVDGHWLTVHHSNEALRPTG